MRRVHVFAAVVVAFALAGAPAQALLRAGPPYPATCDDRADRVSGAPAAEVVAPRADEILAVRTQPEGTASADSLCDSPDLPAQIRAGDHLDLLESLVDPEDWFAFRGFCSEALLVTVAPRETLDARLSVLRSPRGSPLGTADAGGAAAPETVETVLPSSADWLLHVAEGRIEPALATIGATSVYAGAYLLRVGATPPPLDAGTGADAPAEPPVSPAAIESCLVGTLTPDDVDAYAFRTPAKADLSLELLPGRDRGLAVTLTGPDARVVRHNVTSEGSVLVVEDAPAGAWKVSIARAAGEESQTPADARDNHYGLACRPMCLRVG